MTIEQAQDEIWRLERENTRAVNALIAERSARRKAQDFAGELLIKVRVALEALKRHGDTSTIELLDPTEQIRSGVLG